MTFLKKLGQILAKATQVIVGFGPVVGTMVPGSAGVIGQIQGTIDQLIELVVSVEALGVKLGLSGVQKLEAATMQAAKILVQSTALAGRKIANESLFMQGVKRIVEGIVDVLNAFKAEDIKTDDPAG